jgi:hypothetical protein
LGEDEEYINLIKYYLDNYEKIINNKIPRKPGKSQKSTQIKYENKKDIKYLNFNLDINKVML